MKNITATLLIAATIALVGCSGNAASQKAELAEFKLEQEKERAELRQELWLETERARQQALVVTPAEVKKRRTECETQIQEAVPCAVPSLNDAVSRADVDEVHKILLAESVCREARQERIEDCYRRKGLHDQPAFVDPKIKWGEQL